MENAIAADEIPNDISMAKSKPPKTPRKHITGNGVSAIKTT